MTLQYIRPRCVEEAVALLDRHGRRARPLAGGSWLTPRLRSDVEIAGSLAGQVDLVVDLANLPLSYVASDGQPGNGWLRIGATTPLAALLEDPLCQTLAGGILAEGAGRAGPLNQRNTATAAGCIVAGDQAMELLLALAALSAHLVLADGTPIPLEDASPARLITEIRLPWPAAAGGGLARVARTPADQPIVAAAAVVGDFGARVVLGGVAAQALVVETPAAGDLGAALAAGLGGVQAVSDFRGSAEYRLAMAPIIARRAVEAASR